jgi:monoamine oxidase
VRDVVVVGAGLSGLTAARRLADAGADVLVLEARDRVGGKMHSVSAGGATVDLGAHWVGPTQARVLELARELGVATAPQHLEGRHVAMIEGRRLTYRGAAPLAVLHLPGLVEFELFGRWLERLAREVPVERPWASAHAGRLDSWSVAAYARPRVRTALGASMLRLTWRLVLGAELEELSLLYTLFYLRSAGGLKALTEIEGGAQQDFFPGGSAQLCGALATRLGPRVHLGEPVSAIARDGQSVVVRTPAGSVRAEHVIVALAPALTRRLAFEPPLPSGRVALAQRMPNGAYAKFVAVYDEPWWREAGLSGLVYDLSGPVQMVVDVSENGLGTLMGFVSGQPVHAWSALDEERRRRVALSHLARSFGPRAANPRAYVECIWNDEPWSEGAPVGLMGPGTMATFGGSLAPPAGRVHWAGTETAVHWNGYMDGAIEAGRARGRRSARTAPELGIRSRLGGKLRSFPDKLRQMVAGGTAMTRERSRILVVDDEQVNLKLLEAMLTGWGYPTVIATNDPTAAIDLVAAHDPICCCSTCRCRLLTGSRSSRSSPTASEARSPCRCWS